jgi:hypothetical protein
MKNVFALMGVMACSSGGGAPNDPQGQGGDSARGGQSASGGVSGSGASAGAGSAGTTSTGGVAPTGGTSGSGGSSGKGGAAGGGGDASGRGGVAGDSGAPAGGSQAGGSGGSGGSSGSGGEAGGGEPGEYGFSYRVPGSHQFECTGEPVDVPDQDWLCTFSQGDRLAYVYVQATPVGVACVLASYGNYEVGVAQISIDGVVSPLADAAYDWGGGHHNDSLSFTYEGKTYKYYHSSFGFGFRKCQSMDCVNVYAPGSMTPEVEGCGSDRSLPEVCVLIDAERNHEPLVDEFMKCPGDTE